MRGEKEGLRSGAFLSEKTGKNSKRLRKASLEKVGEKNEERTRMVEG